MRIRDVNNISEENEQPHTPKAFFCIYTQRDEAFYRELRTHLRLWERERVLFWLEISGGDDIEQTTQNFLQQADCILLFISPDFFANDSCYMAMKAALSERDRRQVQVVPILARPSGWKESACGKLKALPESEQPIELWSHSEEAYEHIRAGLARLLPGFFPSTTILPVRSRIFQARSLPDGYVPRPKAFETIKRQLLAQHGGQAAITTALRGAGGFGKTTLALALCHDLEIQEAFPDGILWVELGEQPPRTLDLLNGLLAPLEASHMPALTLEEARVRWTAALGARVYLLVIDDVWQPAELRILLEGGPRCVRLITTRNDLLLPQKTTRVVVDAMEVSEAMTVLCQGLLDEIRQSAYQSALEALVTRLSCWPLLLTLAHGMLIDLVKYRERPENALATIAHAYEARGVTAFRLDYAEDRQRTAAACLEVSIQHLEQFAPAHYHATECYLELAVFPEDTDIPLATLQTFWKGCANLEAWEVKDLCIRLHELSLLLTCDLEQGTIRLHDVLRSYLQQRTKSELPVLHTHLLDAYWQVHHLQRWADLPANDVYIWQHLIYHFCQVGSGDVIHTTLTSLTYLTRKALYINVSALESDILLASVALPAETANLAPSLFRLLHRNITRISHLLQQVHTEAEIGGLLLSHLGWDHFFAEQRLSLERGLPHPFLTAQHPLPDRSSSALIRTLHGHTDGVNSCAISPDGSWLVSGSDDKTLKVWDVATGEERRTLEGHTDKVYGCAISPDGSWLVSTSFDKTLKIWDVATGEERRTLEGHTDKVYGCAISADGSWLVSASADKTLKIWDVATGEERHALTGHIGSVNSCAISPDGCWIVSASEDCTLSIWDAANGEERFVFFGHTEVITNCAISPDGCWIVSAAMDQTLKAWDIVSGKERFTLIGHDAGVNDCAISPDGRWIVSAAMDQTLKVWDVISGEERFTLSGHAEFPEVGVGVTCCAVGPDGRWIVSASTDQTLKVWEMVDREDLFAAHEYTGIVNSCAISPDGSWLVSGSDDKTLKIWDVTSGNERVILCGHTGIVTCCAISPDGSWLVSGSDDKTLKIWDAVSGEERFTLIGHVGRAEFGITGCAVSPDGHWVVSTSFDDTLKVWDTFTGKERFSLISHTGGVNSCTISPDGRYIISASGDKTLKLWDTITGQECRTFIGHAGWVSSCAISPDGRYIISASGDKTLKLWDIITGQECRTFIGHTGPVNGCAMSPDGGFLVSVSSDKTLKLWAIQTGRCLLTFPVSGPLSGCAFHPDGEQIVACGTEGVYFLRLVI